MKRGPSSATLVLAMLVSMQAGWMQACSFDTSVPQGPGEASSDAGAFTDSAPNLSADGASPQPNDGAVDDAGSTSPVQPTGQVTESGTVGGSGGSPFGPNLCPSGSVVIGVDGDFYLGGDNGAGFCNFKAVCGEIAGDGGGGVTVTQVGMIPTGSGLGFCGQPPTDLGTLLCPANGVVTGYSAVRSGLYQAITEMQLQCATLDSTGAILSQAYTGAWGSVIGSSQGPNTVDCSSAQIATGIYGGVGAVIDRLGFDCQGMTVAP